MIVGSCYSGIGGADAGFASAGWQIGYQAEIDPWRRRVLSRHWPSAHRLGDIRDIPGDAAVAHGACTYGPWLCYGELPDRDIKRWWPSVWAAARATLPSWLAIECSPAVPCDRVLRDLALAGWHFRVLQVGITLATSSLPERDWHVRDRLIVLASQSEQAVQDLPLVAFSLRMQVDLGAIQADRSSVEFVEASVGLPFRWSCLCGAQLCSCSRSLRLLALRDATPPHLTIWLAKLLDGSWKLLDGHTDGDLALDVAAPILT